jgi:hypothetical protein
VVAVGVRDHRAIDRAPRIDVEVARGAVKAAGSRGDEHGLQTPILAKKWRPRGRGNQVPAVEAARAGVPAAWGRPSSARASAGVATLRPCSAHSLATALDQRGIRRGERVAVEAHVVLHPGAAMSAQLQRPAREGHLVAPDAGAGEGRLRRQPPQGLHVELEHVAVHRHRVANPHHELHVQRSRDGALALHLRCLEDHRQVERLDLGLHAVRAHFGGEPFDQVGACLS